MKTSINNTIAIYSESEEFSPVSQLAKDQIIDLHAYRFGLVPEHMTDGDWEFLAEHIESLVFGCKFRYLVETYHDETWTDEDGEHLLAYNWNRCRWGGHNVQKAVAMSIEEAALQGDHACWTGKIHLLIG
jgi:hypothetical protein